MLIETGSTNFSVLSCHLVNGQVERLCCMS
jgi:hypothetical protein